MSYRPITDMWILARAKMKPNPDGSKNTYYGAYLGGFPERARVLIGVRLSEPVLHVCGGKSKHYPYARGFGDHDKTMDIDATLNPDFVGDAGIAISHRNGLVGPTTWPGILIDPPYTPEDAQKYATGNYPAPNALVQNAFKVLDVGGKVGIIHYIVPACPKNGKFIACVGVICGFNNRIRVFSVYEKVS